uniref:DNA primase n=1 Tax=Geladintestivirus 2 TaxID=3233134 RepID=A0AAU8MGP7_9CAUD
MKRNINTIKLTKSYIESKISQELIISKYLNIPIETVIKCIDKNTLIPSVFRDDDKNGSMGIQYNSKGKIKVRDFGGFGFFGDVYDVVAYTLSIICGRKIEPNNKQDFYFILKHIAYTFSDLIDNKTVDENLTETINNAINIGKKRRAIIEIVPRSWNKSDKQYWNNLGVNLSYLNAHFVIPVDQYYVDRGVDSTPKYYYKSKDPCYAYMLGQNNKGINFIKLYFPNRNKATECKFITNCNVLEGLINLELNNYDYILITKSSKDRLSIGSYLSSQPFYGGTKSQLNIGIINLPSENYHLTNQEYDWLRNKLSSGGMIISLLDFDYTGRIGAKYMYDMYNIPYIFITRGEFGLPNYKDCKDFAELVTKYTKEEIIQFINETITYIKIKYGTENVSSFERWSDLPYFM